MIPSVAHGSSDERRARRSTQATGEALCEITKVVTRPASAEVQLLQYVYSCIYISGLYCYRRSVIILYHHISSSTAKYIYRLLQYTNIYFII